MPSALHRKYELAKKCISFFKLTIENLRKSQFFQAHTGNVTKSGVWLWTSVADPDPWNPYHFPGSVSYDTDPDPTKTIENIK